MDAYGGAFSYLYANAGAATERYSKAVDAFEKLFGTGREVIFISAPGRTEIGGNHTDHQRGSVLAAAVDLDVICVVSPKRARNIHIVSEGHRPDTVDLDDLTPQSCDAGHAASLIRGVADWFVKNGYNIGGLDAYTTSQVLGGSGLSSSAAFEVAVGGMLNHLYNGGTIPPERIAMAGQYAENAHFGKPSGLMDQMASSVGGFVQIDFANPDSPVITPLSFDLDAKGYTLCVVDTKGTHADLTGDYAAIPAEMRAIAQVFGNSYLSEVDEGAFYAELSSLRAAAGDRAVLRAMHFFDDNRRVGEQARALFAGDITGFLKLVRESGESSFTCLQNIYANPREQGLSLALALSRRILSGTGGAWRVHGGGFAGTIQAYVPHDILPRYRSTIESVFGDGTCRSLKIRPVGGVKLWRN